MRSKELAARIGITEANVSLLKSGKVRGARFDTLA
jgi:putative transcriptional regulator